jgi:hypothetical protein
LNQPKKRLRRARIGRDSGLIAAQKCNSQIKKISRECHRAR